MKRDAFSGFHPFVSFFYFTAAIGFSMFFMHPMFLAVSFVCAVAYAAYLKTGFKFMLPLLIFTALLNPLFNHQGATILAYLPGGNPLTLEAVIYGVAAAAMLVTVITWFSCFNAVITSDKLIYLFGRVIPALSLILSMSLRFVPRFIAQIKIISNAQKCIGNDFSGGGLFHKAKHGIKILSITVTWALENSIETAESMKARGYGLPGRTAFSVYRFRKRDFYAAAFIFVCAAVIISGAFTGAFHFRYFPDIKGGFAGFYSAVYIILCAFPIIINLKEDFAWKRIKSKT